MSIAVPSIAPGAPGAAAPSNAPARAPLAAGPLKPPSRLLVIAHMGLGLAGLLFFAGALALRASAAGAPAFQPLVLGLAHTAVLGWLLPTALGALHRLSPLLLGDTVASERLSWGALALYVFGAAGLTGHLWTFATGWGLPLSATVLALSILLYAGNFAAALVRGRERGGPSAPFVAAALAWLAVTATLGAVLAWNLHAPLLTGDHTLWLKAHAHAGGLGFFGLLVMGAALRLLELFLVSRGAPLDAARAALLAVNGALVSLVLGFTGIGPEALVPAGACFAAIGIGCFIAQARAIHARSLSRRLDHALRHTAASLVWLIAAAAVGLALALGIVPFEWQPGLEVAYGALAILGFVGGVVTGQLYKILPSLLAPVAPVAGPRLVTIRKAGAAPAAPARAPGDPLDAPRTAQWALVHAGVAAIALGLALDVAALRTAGAVLFAGGAVMFTADVARMKMRGA